MKRYAKFFYGVGLALFLAGCASHDRGGVDDDYYKGYGTRMTGNNATNTTPPSPTFRPAMSPDEVRDPEGLKVPWKQPGT